MLLLHPGATIPEIMHRLTTALMLGGGVLLLSYVNAPAAPTPAPVRVSPEELAAIEAMAPVAAEVAQEAERLKARLAAGPDQPVVGRNPFVFGGSRPTPPELPRATPETFEDVIPDTAAEPALVWPQLVAVLKNDSADDPLSVVLAYDDTVDILQTGGRLGGFRVAAVGTNSVELVHVASAARVHLSLR